jgi:hypothetical protein
MPNERILGQNKISTLFKNYRRRIQGIWLSYSLVHHYSFVLHNSIRNDEIETLRFRPFMATSDKHLSKVDTISYLINLRERDNPRRTLLDGLGLFEDFLGRLVDFVYEDYPGKLLGGDIEQSEQQSKLLRIIIDSNSREEILRRIAEERIRTIFYGNPVHFFTKDKAKLEFGNYFTSRTKAMAQFQELMARRNVIVHNGGRVDRKYLAETNNKSFKLDQAVSLEQDYIRESLILLECLGGAVATKVLCNVYKEEVNVHSVQMRRSFKAFERKFPD